MSEKIIKIGGAEYIVEPCEIPENACVRVCDPVEEDCVFIIAAGVRFMRVDLIKKPNE